jgi:hypothetical protein
MAKERRNKEENPDLSEQLDKRILDTANDDYKSTSLQWQDSPT